MKFVRDTLAVYGLLMAVLLLVYLATGGAHLVVDVLIGQGVITWR